MKSKKTKRFTNFMILIQKIIDHLSILQFVKVNINFSDGILFNLQR